MLTSFPDGPRSSAPPVQAVDDSHRRRRMGSVVLNERGQEVLHWPDVIPDGWSVSRRIVAMDGAGMLDSAVGAAGGAAMNLEDVFEALPRGLQRKRMQVEVDIANASDAFERVAALRLAETLIRECQNIADMADEGHIPWDAGVADQGILAQAARSAADLRRNPRAPTSSTSLTRASVSFIVKDQDLDSRKPGADSTPLSVGRPKSRTATSGLVATASSTACGTERRIGPRHRRLFAGERGRGGCDRAPGCGCVARRSCLVRDNVGNASSQGRVPQARGACGSRRLLHSCHA